MESAQKTSKKQVFESFILQVFAHNCRRAPNEAKGDFMQLF